MMYSEFVEGTGCKENEHNYKVFRNLEAMYMNTEMTKAEIYEYGKKLVDNSKSEEQIRFENEIKAQIEEKNNYIKEYKTEIETYKYYLIGEEDKNWQYEWKQSIKWRKELIKKLRNEIAALKWVLA